MDLRGVECIDRGGGRFLLVCTERYFLHPVTSFFIGNERRFIDREGRET